MPLHSHRLYAVNVFVHLLQTIMRKCNDLFLDHVFTADKHFYNIINGDNMYILMTLKMFS